MDRLQVRFHHDSITLASPCARDRAPAIGQFIDCTYRNGRQANGDKALGSVLHAGNGGGQKRE